MGMQAAVRLRLWDKRTNAWADEDRFRAVVSPRGIIVAANAGDDTWKPLAESALAEPRFECYAELPLGEKPLGLAQADPPPGGGPCSGCPSAGGPGPYEDDDDPRRGTGRRV